MLTITIPSKELFDEKNQTFISSEEQTLELNHSLVSVSKWESKWCKPFISKEEKTMEETIDYIKCMTITPNVDPNVYNTLINNSAIVTDINNYIGAPMTATTFSEHIKQSRNNETVTSELIYYWMISFNIPMECQDWHLNRLLTLIRVCDIKNTPPKKMGKRDLINKYADLNAARRKQFNSKG